MMCFRKTFIFFIFLIAISIQLYGETFRVHELIPLKINENAEIGINDSIAVRLPEDRTFIEGLEFIIQIPKILTEWRDSVAMTVYNNISPAPEKGIIDFYGTKQYVSTLPSKMTWLVHIPLRESTSIKNDGYVTKIEIPVNENQEFLFLRFQPAMKGVPDDVYSEKLKISVKPILINKGMLNLTVKDTDSNDVSAEITIDDQNTILNNGKILLSPGNHSITIHNDNYRNETHSIIIEQAKITDINIVLKSSEPTICITAPNNAQIFLDNANFIDLDKEKVISEGEHQIKMQIGGYEVIRTINIQKGKSYRVNLAIELDITEE